MTKILLILISFTALISIPFYLYKKFRKSKLSAITNDKNNAISGKTKSILNDQVQLSSSYVYDNELVSLSTIISSTASETNDDIPSFSLTIKQAKPSRFVDDDELVSITSSSADKSPDYSTFRIPSIINSVSVSRWIPKGQSFKVAGVTIPDGMVYFGTTLISSSGINEPSLIDPSKKVSSRGDFTKSEMDYWPSYSEISKTDRRSYLNWLADGRRAPDANIGYVFLFFYGLEHRALIDASHDTEAKMDLPIIAEEISRLLAIYGEKSNSFLGYARTLFNWVSLVHSSEKLYQKPMPIFAKTFELPLYLRLALGQAARDGVPISAPLALTWIKYEPTISLRTPAVRCAKQFDKLFQLKYAEKFSTGLILPLNRTKLKLLYRPASSCFQGFDKLKLSFGDIPDVTALTAPQKKLQEIIEVTTKQLDPYSRYLGQHNNAECSLEALLLLPTLLWPEDAVKNLQTIKTKVDSGSFMMTFQELLSTCGVNSTLNRDKTLILARTLESIHIGIEPNILAGSKLPKPTDSLVLFSMQSEDKNTIETSAYQAALLTLQLASVVAVANGEFSASKLNHLRNEVQSWTHLTPNHIMRLLAHLQLLVVVPVTLSSLKNKLVSLDIAVKESIAAFMSTFAQFDGTITPNEVKTLEKVYNILGISTNKVFSDIHAIASGSKLTNVNVYEESGFKLDSSRITALQQETEKVSKLLANIFNEEDDFAIQHSTEKLTASESESVSDSILGLDAAHTALAKILLSRSEWSRAALLELAGGLDLMLDGALEHINEAAFDNYDIPFTEGDDLIEVNAEILEKIDL